MPSRPARCAFIGARNRDRRKTIRPASAAVWSAVWIVAVVALGPARGDAASVSCVITPIHEGDSYSCGGAACWLAGGAGEPAGPCTLTHGLPGVSFQNEYWGTADVQGITQLGDAGTYSIGISCPCRIQTGPDVIVTDSATGSLTVLPNQPPVVTLLRAERWLPDVCVANCAARPTEVQQLPDDSYYVAVRAGDILGLHFDLADPDSATFGDVPYIVGYLPDGSLLSDSGSWQTTPADVGVHIVQLELGDGVNVIPVEVVVDVGIGYPTLRAIEVSQVIQNWNDTVPLVEGKPTWVRAFFVMPPGGIQGDRVRAQLRGYDAFTLTELPESPLQPMNPDGVEARLDLSGRERFDASLNFRLPDHWVLGVLRVVVERTDGESLVCGTPEAPVDPQCGTQVVVDAVEPLDVRFWIVEQTDPALPGTPFVASRGEVRRTKRRIKDVLPIAEMTRQQILRTRFAGDLTQDAEQSRLLELLARKRLWRVNYGLDGEETIHHGLVGGQVGNVRPDYSGIARGDHVSWSTFYPSGTPNRASFTYLAAHEIAHNLGTPHPGYLPRVTPEGDQFLDGPCGSEWAVGPVFPPGYPYVYDADGDGSVEATIGYMDAGPNELVYGLRKYLDENRLAFSRVPRVVAPDEHFSLMSYCGPEHEWLSEYDYAPLLGEINRRFAPAGGAGAAAPSVPGAPHFLVSGVLDWTTLTARLSPVEPVVPTVVPNAPLAGEFVVSSLDASGGVLDTVYFEPEPLSETTDYEAFAFLLPADPATASVALAYDGDFFLLLDQRVVTPNAPTVQLLAPNGGEVLTGSQALAEWTASDADGDLLRFALEWSADGGATWTLLDMDIVQSPYAIDLSTLEETSNGRLRITASDGLRSAQDESDGAFAVGPAPPEVSVASLVDGERFWGSQPLRLEADAEDREDGVLGGASLQWVSSLDGPIGVGEAITIDALSLSEGDHVLSVIATDSGGATASDALQVHIQRAPPVADLGLSSGAPMLIAEPGLPVSFTRTVSNLGPEPSTGVTVLEQWPGNLIPTGATPSQGACVLIGAVTECWLDALAPGAVASIAFQGMAGSASISTSRARAYANEGDPDPTNDEIRVTSYVPEPTIPGGLGAGIVALSGLAVRRRRGATAA